ncbi:putative baseplate assembly protein [Streptomyces sp. ODS28]|uniref:putative baseplate assembly protein n=1 Tax=Streptomyces sp. ODS28 TaxID=3136688 RepID=UPI0031EB5039
MGTHGTFLDTMRAALSHDPRLAALHTRSTDDPAIALLDAWSLVADVLSFYTERIANEGYLRTAAEHRSLIELGRLLGYRPRPGLAASTYLAYLLEEAGGSEVTATVPRGSRAQSVPLPGELPQTYETSGDVLCRTAWNTLRPRLSLPQVLRPDTTRVYVQGIDSALQAGDRLLLAVEEKQPPKPYLATAVRADADAQRTSVEVMPLGPPPPPPPVSLPGTGPGLGQLITALRKPPTRTPARPRRTLEELYGPGSDLGPQLLAAVTPGLDTAALYRAWAGARLSTGLAPDRAAVLRVRAAPFGATAPMKPVLNQNGATVATEEWPLEGIQALRAVVSFASSAAASVEIGLDDGHDARTVSVKLPATTRTELPLPGLGSVTVEGGTSVAGAGELTLEVRADTGLTRKITVGEPEPHPALAAAAQPSAVYGSGRLPVTFDDEPEAVWRPADGQTLRASGGARRISVGATARPKTLDIGYGLLLPSPEPSVVHLDAVHERILPGTPLLIDYGGGRPPLVTRVVDAGTAAIARYGMSALVTRLVLAHPWLRREDVLLSDIRRVTVHAQGERLELAAEPWQSDLTGCAIPLDGLYEGLRPGRRLVVTGERTDVPGGVEGAELVMVSEVTQGAEPTRPGDTPHTTLALASCLSYTYRRHTVRIWGNVVAATQGETVSEVLGSGDAAIAGQTFTLHRTPLTYLPAPTPSGAQSTLAVRADGLRWHEGDAPQLLGPRDRAYTTRQDAEGTTTLAFGDGEHGARLPTGAENVTADYRAGLGRAGNVRPWQITQPLTRPLGVSSVTNPVRASGGADPDRPEQIRTGIPPAVIALDRLVSVSDYADFSRARSGIGKASARRLARPDGALVHVTVAGTDGGPVGPASELMAALRRALAQLGDPALPVTVADRELSLIVVAAGVSVDAEHRWDLVEARVRQTLLDRFGPDARDLGEDVVLSRVIATAQAVPGVLRFDVATFGLIPGDLTPEQLSTVAQGLAGAPPPRLPVALARRDATGLHPAQLAVLSREVPDTLILREV